MYTFQKKLLLDVVAVQPLAAQGNVNQKRQFAAHRGWNAIALVSGASPTMTKLFWETLRSCACARHPGLTSLEAVFPPYLSEKAKQNKNTASQNWLLCFQSNMPSIDYRPSLHSACRCLTCGKNESREAVFIAVSTGSAWPPTLACEAPSFSNSISHSLLLEVVFFFMLPNLYLKISRVLFFSRCSTYRMGQVGSLDSLEKFIISLHKEWGLGHRCPHD